MYQLFFIPLHTISLVLLHASTKCKWIGYVNTGQIKLLVLILSEINVDNDTRFDFSSFFAQL